MKVENQTLTEGDKQESTVSTATNGDSRFSDENAMKSESTHLEETICSPSVRINDGVKSSEDGKIGKKRKLATFVAPEIGKVVSDKADSPEKTKSTCLSEGSADKHMLSKQVVCKETVHEKLKSGNTVQEEKELAYGNSLSKEMGTTDREDYKEQLTAGAGKILEENTAKLSDCAGENVECDVAPKHEESYVRVEEDMREGVKAGYVAVHEQDVPQAMSEAEELNQTQTYRETRENTSSADKMEGSPLTEISAVPDDDYEGKKAGNQPLLKQHSLSKEEIKKNVDAIDKMEGSSATQIHAVAADSSEGETDIVQQSEKLSECPEEAIRENMGDAKDAAAAESAEKQNSSSETDQSAGGKASDESMAPASVEGVAAGEVCPGAVTAKGTEANPGPVGSPAAPVGTAMATATAVSDGEARESMVWEKVLEEAPSRKPQTRFRGLDRQYLVALIANVSSVGSGAALGWTAPALPVLLSPEAGGGWGLSIQQGSWAVAALPLGALLGTLAALPPLARRAPPKRALLALSAPAVLGWALIAFAQLELWALLLGRLLTGVAAGAGAAFVQRYCSEVAAGPGARRALASALYPSTVLGTAWACAFALALPMEGSAAACAALHALFALASAWMPESPAHLAARGRMDEARAVLQWLRRASSPDDVDAELSAILSGLKLPPDGPPRPPLRSRAFLASPGVRAFAIVTALLCLQQLSGVNAFVLYTVSILNTVENSLPGPVDALVLACVHFVAAAASSALAPRLPRRPALAASAFAGAFFMAAFGAYAHFQRLAYPGVVESWGWVPPVSLALYMASHAPGLGCLPPALAGELVPAEARAWAPPAAAVLSRALSVALAKEVPILIDVARHDAVFGLFFPGFCLAAGLYAVAAVPETKDRTPEEVRRALGGDKV